MAAVKTILQRNINARDSITAKANSTNPHAAAGTIAAEPTAGSARGVRIYLAGGNKNRSAGSTRAAQAASL